jgi:hypothetical protein
VFYISFSKRKKDPFNSFRAAKWAFRSSSRTQSEGPRTDVLRKLFSNKIFLNSEYLYFLENLITAELLKTLPDSSFAFEDLKYQKITAKVTERVMQDFKELVLIHNNIKKEGLAPYLHRQ